MLKRPFWLLLIFCTGLMAGDFEAVRVETGPEVDGVLDDPAWSSAPPVRSVFTQFNPVHGEPMSDPTEVRILYDSDAIYFGLLLFDSAPERMSDNLTQRAVYIPGDWIAVLLDTYNEGREVSTFEVNLAGSIMDSKVNPYGEWDYSWDAVWDCATSRNGEGWVAEFRIPFSALRFGDEEEQVWAVNFQRVQYGTGENGWCVLSLGHDQADIDNFATLTGLSGLSRPVGIELRPYGASRVYGWDGEEDVETDLNAGVDVKLGISADMTTDLTFNPDFGQVEADEEEMNLSYYELFLREKRPFFMESSETFEMPFNMLYTRRIGAVAQNGEVIPILAGAKLSGGIGSDLRIGFLDAVTGRVSDGDSLIEPLSNYSALSVRQSFSSSLTYAGLYAVSKEVPGQDGFEESRYARALGADFRLGLPSDLVMAASVAGSWNSDSDDGHAASLAFGRMGSGLFYVLESSYLSESFDVNGTGYTTVTDRITTDLDWHYTFRPERAFQWIGFGGHGYYQVTSGGEITGRCVSLGPFMRFSGGCNIEANIGYSGSRHEPFEGPSGHEYPEGFDFWVDGSINWRAPVSLWAGLGGGASSHGGTYESYNATLTLRPLPAFSASLGAESFRTFGEDRYNWEASAFDSRDSRWRSALLRGSYLFSPDLSIRLFAQYSRFSLDYDLSEESVTDQLRANVLFGWQFRPGSMVYLLFEEMAEDQEGEGLGSPSFGAFGKVSWFLSI